MISLSKAAVRKALAAQATEIRSFPESIWPLWHEQSGRALPIPLSRGTCGRSSLFLGKALDFEGFDAEIAIGNPFDTDGQTRVSAYGFFSGHRWESHTWVCCENMIVDITADQFDAAPVVVTDVDDPLYRANHSDAADPSSITARHAAVESVWPHWLAFRDSRPILLA